MKLHRAISAAFTIGLAGGLMLAYAAAAAGVLGWISTPTVSGCALVCAALAFASLIGDLALSRRDINQHVGAANNGC